MEVRIGFKMWTVVRSFIVVLLLATAALKVGSVDTLLRRGGLLSNPFSISLAVGFELFAACLIALAPGRFAHRFAVLVFLSFLVVAGFAWLLGQDCNCFGSQSVGALPILIDVGCLVCLAVFHPADSDATKRDFVFASRLVGGSFGFAMLGSMLVFGHATHSFQDDAMPAAFDKQMIGKPFPLYQFDQVQEVLASGGTTLWVLMRPDCDHCHQFARDWDMNSLDSDTRIVSVSMSPNRWTVMPGVVSATIAQTSDNFELEWADASEPFVAAPTIVTVNEGIVQDFASGDIDRSAL